MKIYIICSKAFYKEVAPIKEKLEKKGYIVELPFEHNTPELEEQAWKSGREQHAEFKARMFRESAEMIDTVDAVLTLNFNKKGIKNYIGGSTFLELYEAFMKNKKIYLYNDIPEGMLFDEINGFDPIIINGNLNLIGETEKI